jgi:holliday junction DNA helicase RuvA
MIGYLKGTIKLAQDNQVIVLCNGIGWAVHTGSRVFVEGTEVELFIHTQVRENDISLWGVISPTELMLFRMLLNVSGVGGKTALTLVTEKGVGGIVRAISFMEGKDLQVSGVGKKTTEKIILELKDKISGIPMTDIPKSEQPVDLSPTLRRFTNDAIEALQNLGYKRVDIDQALIQIRDKNVEVSSSENLIRELLKIL